MGLKLRLEWYNKQTEFYEGEEYSEDLGYDGSVIEALGTPIENNINNGGFNVPQRWKKISNLIFSIQLIGPPTSIRSPSIIETDGSHGRSPTIRLDPLLEITPLDNNARFGRVVLGDE